MNADEAAVAVTPLLGYTPSREQIAVAFLDVDQDAITKAAGKRLKWERWDKETAINGVAADVVMAHRDDYEGGEVYLIYQDDCLMFFQPFDPTSGEQMTEENVDSAAKAHVASMVEALVHDDLAAAIVAAVTASAPATPFRPWERPGT